MARIDRPRVILTSTMSLDGRITVGPEQLLLDPRAAEQWRALQPASTASVIAGRTAVIADEYRPGVVLEGSGTFVRDGELPEALPPDDGDDDLHSDFLPTEVTDRARHARWFAVVDGRGRCRWTFTGADDTDLLVLVARSTPRPYLAYLRREMICYLIVGDDGVHLPTALARFAELGVSSVIADSGGRLNAALLAEDLVDEVQLVVVPALIGGGTTPSLVDGPRSLDPPPRLRFRSSHVEADGVLRLSYEIDRDAPDTVP